MLKKVLKLIIISVPFLFMGQSAQANVNDFIINTFEADYYLDRNNDQISTLKVSEVIEVEFPDRDQNHGILRAIPKSYQSHTVSLDIQDVTNENGGKWNYTTENQNDNLVLRIGDADKYVRGRQVFRINYSMRNVISFQENSDEFYWDINGDQWPQALKSVTGRIHIPKSLTENLDGRSRCFAGYYGQADSRTCTISYSDGGEETVITVKGQNLEAFKTVSVVAGFNKGTFKLGPEIAAEQRWRKFILFATVAGIALPPVLTCVWIYGRWRKYGRDPSGRGVIVPEYLPPKNLNALSSSVILNEHVQNKAISALMIELAIQKYLKIYEIPKNGIFGKTDYELEVIKNPDELDEEQMKALRMFFSDGATKGAKVRLSDLKNKLHSEIGTLSKSVETKLFEQGYFASNPEKTRGRYRIRGIILIVVGFVVGFLVVTIPAGIGLGISGLLIILFAGIMPARSKEGVKTREYLLGLRDYMKLAESERIKFLQSPKGAEKLSSGIDPKNPKSQVKLFEALLPYAMLFGIEKDWAKQFEHLYTQPPDWYSGNWQAFSAVHLASSLAGFSSSSVASFTSPSSSGSSGFGGGGFSGGGGGGGGGGGW